MASEEVLRTYERLLTGAVDPGDGSGEEYALTIANPAHGAMLRVMAPNTLRPIVSMDRGGQRLTLTNADDSQTVFVLDDGFWRVQRHILPSEEAI